MVANALIKFLSYTFHIAHEKEAITPKFSKDNILQKKITHYKERQIKCNMKRVQDEKAAWKQCITEKSNMKKVRHETSAIWTKVQHENSATRKKWKMKRVHNEKINMKEVQHEKSGTWGKCTMEIAKLKRVQHEKSATSKKKNACNMTWPEHEKSEKSETRGKHEKWMK